MGCVVISELESIFVTLPRMAAHIAICRAVDPRTYFFVVNSPALQWQSGQTVLYQI